MFFQELRLDFAIDQWDEMRASEKDEDNNRLKIIFSFTRRYLGNLNSYRDKSRIVLKGKVLRF